jgi:hypothetical protein
MVAGVADHGGEAGAALSEEGGTGEGAHRTDTAPSSNKEAQRGSLAEAGSEGADAAAESEHGSDGEREHEYGNEDGAPDNRRGPNWDSTEAVALMWAGVSQDASKHGTSLSAWQNGTLNAYLPKARELARLGKWDSPRTPEESFAMRCRTPGLVWKSLHNLRSQVAHDVTPIWTKVEKTKPAGWEKYDVINETRNRYYRFRKKNTIKSPYEKPPPGWTCPQWEVFMFHGAPGTNEPCLRLGSPPLGPSSRVAKKALKRAREADAGTEAPSELASEPTTAHPADAGGNEGANGGDDGTGNGNDAIPIPVAADIDGLGAAAAGPSAPTAEQGDALKIIALAASSISVSYSSHVDVLKRQADAASTAARAKERLAAVEVIKLQLQTFSPGTAEHTAALYKLKTLY